MNHALTWNDIVTELPTVILTVFFLGAIIGGAVVAHFKKRGR